MVQLKVCVSGEGGGQKRVYKRFKHAHISLCIFDHCIVNQHNVANCCSFFVISAEISLALLDWYLPTSLESRNRIHVVSHGGFASIKRCNVSPSPQKCQGDKKVAGGRGRAQSPTSL